MFQVPFIIDSDSPQVLSVFKDSMQLMFPELICQPIGWDESKNGGKISSMYACLFRQAGVACSREDMLHLFWGTSEPEHIQGYVSWDFKKVSDSSVQKSFDSRKTYKLNTEPLIPMGRPWIMTLPASTTTITDGKEILANIEEKLSLELQFHEWKRTLPARQRPPGPGKDGVFHAHYLGRNGQMMNKDVFLVTTSPSFLTPKNVVEIFMANSHLKPAWLYDCLQKDKRESHIPSSRMSVQEVDILVEQVRLEKSTKSTQSTKSSRQPYKKI